MTRAPLRRAARRALGLGRAEGGNSAIEFALLGSIFAVMLLNVVDFALMIWAQMEVDYAAEVGAQAAYTTCSPGTMPATTHCATMNSVVTVAAHSTSLGTGVSLASGSPSEAYYCATASNTLQSVGAYSSPPNPFDCTAAGNASETPGDYVTVNVNYSFKPLFAGLSLAPTKTLIATGMQRLK
jgi:Flp pilus assembly protein TadG